MKITTSNVINWSIYLFIVSLAAVIDIRKSANAGSLLDNQVEENRISSEKDDGKKIKSGIYKVQPAFLNIMSMYSRTVKPTLEDTKFLDWWLRIYSPKELSHAKDTQNEIALVDMREKMLKRLNEMDENRLLYLKIPVHLGNYDLDKEEFSIEFPFYDGFTGEPDDGHNGQYNRGNIQESCLAYPDPRKVWFDHRSGSFPVKAYLPFYSTDKADSSWSLIINPYCHSGEEYGEPLLHVKLQMKSPPPWSGLYVPKAQAKDLLDQTGIYKTVNSKFVFKVLGDMQVNEFKPISTALYKSPKKLTTATVYIEPIALYTWTPELAGSNSASMAGREVHSFYRFVGALGYVGRADVPSGGEETDGIITVALSTYSKYHPSQANTDTSNCPSNLPADADRQRCSYQVDLAQGGLYVTQDDRLVALPKDNVITTSEQNKISKPVMEVPPLPQESQPTTLTAPEIKQIPIVGK